MRLGADFRPHRAFGLRVSVRADLGPLRRLAHSCRFHKWRSFSHVSGDAPTGIWTGHVTQSYETSGIAVVSRTHPCEFQSSSRQRLLPSITRNRTTVHCRNRFANYGTDQLKPVRDLSHSTLDILPALTTTSENTDLAA